MVQVHNGRIYVISILLLFNILSKTEAQTINLGLKYSYGKMHFIRQSDALKTPVYHSNRIAFIAEYSPYFSRIFVCSGVEFESYDLGTSLNIPLTIRVVPGKKISPYFEGGGFYNLSLSATSESYIFKNDGGAKVGAGLLFRPFKYILVDVGYSYRFGLTTSLEEEVILPLYQVRLEEYRRKSGSLDISIKYRF